ncbi:hypothetical protein Tco_0152654 [Tanacetum coccineum]
MFQERSTYNGPKLERKDQLVIDPYVLAILKGSFDLVSPFIRQTAKLRITKERESWKWGLNCAFLILKNDVNESFEVRIMEMGPDIENMTLNEYLEYEAAKERQSWRNIRSKSSPTRYKGADFNSSHRDKSITLDFPHYCEDAFLKKYCALPLLLPCFRPSQPHNECGYESPNTSNEVDVDSMTIAEYNLYIAKQNKYPLNNHYYSFTPQFFAQPPNTPNIPVDKKDSDLDEILDVLFRIGAENLRRMGQENVQNGRDVDTSRDTNHESDDDDGNTYDIWDFTIKDVKLIRQFLTPNVPDEIDKVIQPLIPQPIHTTPPNDDYVAPPTKLILYEHLEEFGDEILNVTMVGEEADFNPTKDIEELERLLAKDPQSHFTNIHVHSIITKPEPFIHTQTMSPLYGIFESYESSTKPYKVDREMTSPSRYGLKSSFPYPVLTAKRWDSRLMHVSGTWLILGCRETFQARLVGCYIEYDEVDCDCGCCSRKQTWSMALSMLSLHHTEQIQGILVRLSVLVYCNKDGDGIRSRLSMVLLVGLVVNRFRIPTTVPATTPTTDPPVIHDDTSMIPAETPTISPITSTIPPTAPTTHYTSPFIYIDSSDDDKPDTPPSPTHEIPPVEVAPPSQIPPASLGVRRRRVPIVSPGQPIPHGRPYRYHPNVPIHMMTARKRVGPLPTHRIAVRHSVDYSSSDHFTSDDSLRDSPSDFSSETSSDSS